MTTQVPLDRMASNGFTIYCHWGGTIIEAATGISYQGGKKQNFILTPTTNYYGLLSYIHKLLGLNPSDDKLLLICKYPVYENSKWMYRRQNINNDETVRMMMTVFGQTTWLTSLDLYVVVTNRFFPPAVVPPPHNDLARHAPPMQYDKSSTYSHQVPPGGNTPLYKGTSLQPITGTSSGSTPLYKGTSLQPIAGKSSGKTPLHKGTSLQPITGTSSGNTPLHRGTSFQPITGTSSGNTPLYKGTSLQPITGTSSGNTPLYKGTSLQPITGTSSGNTPLYKGTSLQPITGTSSGNTPLYKGTSLPPITGTSSGNTPLYKSSSIKPSAKTSFHPYARTFFQGRQPAYAQYRPHVPEVIAQQYIEEDSAITNINIAVQYVTVFTMGTEEEVDEQEVLDAVDDGDVDDAANGDFSVDRPLLPDFEAPSTYCMDTSRFNTICPCEPTELVRTTVYDPKTDQLMKGLIFKHKHALQDAVCQYHIFRKFELKVVGSNKSMWEVCCRQTDETNCAWRLRGSEKKHRLWEIDTYHGPHTCVQRRFSKDHPQLTADLIARSITHFIKVDPAYKIVAIKAGIFEKYKLNITYYKAWYAKQNAISSVFGDWDASYQDLPKFLRAIQQTNPETIVEWETKPSANSGKLIFDRVFWAFKPCIDGFQYCRPIVSVDATFLFGKYTGNLLIAMTKDANGVLFPLAFAIVKLENLRNWSWFLRLLRMHVAKDRMDLCLIADRHRRILAAINDDKNGWGVTHRAHHRFCLRHVQTNFHKRFGNPILKQLVWEAGACFDVHQFDDKMAKIYEKDPSQGKDAWNWLKELPVEKWSLAHDGGHRFGEMTTNVSESFNGVLRAARFLPITACVHAIFLRCVDLFVEKKDEGIQYIAEGKKLTPHGLLLLEEAKNRSKSNRVQLYNRMEGEGTVSAHIVHLRNNFCSCGYWDAYDFPCNHAISMCGFVNMDESVILPQWCSIDKYVNTWSGNFHPEHNKDYWRPWTCPIWTSDPELLRGKGRQRENRIQNEMESAQ